MGGAESVQENLGWRILEVLPNSPASHKDICVYFEFIVGVNGVRLNASSEMFWNMISKNVDREVILTLFNYKTRLKRDITIIPSSNWGGQGLLGMVVVLFDFTKADESCIRVLKVHDDSPASAAGLQADDDYILGTPVEPFTDIAKFTQVLDDFMEQPLPIWVYNSSRAEIRLTEIIATYEWGGDGVLGCEVGGGLLHNIPSLEDDQTDITVVIPDLLTEDDFQDTAETTNMPTDGMNGPTVPQDAPLSFSTAGHDTPLDVEPPIPTEPEIGMPQPEQMIEDEPIGMESMHMHHTAYGNHVGNHVGPPYDDMPSVPPQEYTANTRNTSLLGT